MPASRFLVSSLLAASVGCGGPLYTGTPELVAEHVYSAPPPIGDATHLYFHSTADEESSIRRVPLAGGPEENLSNRLMGAPAVMALLGEHVWWVAPTATGENVLQRMPKAGGAVEDVRSVEGTPWLRSDGAALYLHQSFRRTSGPITENGTAVFRYVPGAAELEGPFVGDTHVVIAPEGFYTYRSGIGLTRFDGGESERRHVVPGVAVVDLAVGPDELFYVSTYENGFGLGRVARSGGFGRAVVVTGDLPIELAPEAWATDATNVAWFPIPERGKPNSLLRIELRTGMQARVPLVEGSEFVNTMTIAGDALWFVADQSRLYRAPR